MSYTIEDANKFIEEFHDDIMESYKNTDVIPECLKGSRIELVWKAGCFLNECLSNDGATEEEITDIGFCHGQKSFFGDAMKLAVDYANEYALFKSVKDKPGNKLADELNEKHLG